MKCSDFDKGWSGAQEAGQKRNKMSIILLKITPPPLRFIECWMVPLIHKLRFQDVGIAQASEEFCKLRQESEPHYQGFGHESASNKKEALDAPQLFLGPCCWRGERSPSPP